MSPVSVIIVTHNSEAHIIKTLECLLKDKAGPEEIIVVDNASTDNTISMVEEMGIQPVILEDNRGFPYGCNYGASLAHNEILAFLNPDTEPGAGWLPPLLLAIQRSEIGAAMPVMDLTHSPGHWFTSGSVLTYLGFAWSTHTGEKIPANLVEQEVPFPSGAAFVIRRSIFQHLGGFRHEYFLYLEDVDLGWRIRLMGLKSVQVPGSTVAHDYQFDRHERKMYYLERNRLRMVLANYRPSTLFLLAPAFVAVELAIIVISIRHGWIDQKLQSWRDLWHLRSNFGQESSRSQSIRTLTDGVILDSMDATLEGINQFKIHPIAYILNRVAAWYLRLVRCLVS